MSSEKTKNNGHNKESLLATSVEKSDTNNVAISNTNVYLSYTNLKIMNKYILHIASPILIPIYFIA
jgi:hypothetical protein